MNLNVRVNELFDVFREVTLLGQFSGQLSRLCFGGNLAGEEEPEHALGDNLLALRRCRELFLTIRDGQSVEADTL